MAATRGPDRKEGCSYALRWVDWTEQTAHERMDLIHRRNSKGKLIDTSDEAVEVLSNILAIETYQAEYGSGANGYVHSDKELRCAAAALRPRGLSPRNLGRRIRSWHARLHQLKLKSTEFRPLNPPSRRTSSRQSAINTTQPADHDNTYTAQRVSGGAAADAISSFAFSFSFDHTLLKYKCRHYATQNLSSSRLIQLPFTLSFKVVS
jgi:hypothetical protein